MTDCRTVTSWITPTEAGDRGELDRWCAAVGAPLLRTSARAPTRVDRIAVVSWNTKVGQGDLPRLLDDLEAGRLTGEPESAFVVLLQEAHRGGASVPLRAPAGSKYADGIFRDASPDSTWTLEAEAATRGLSLLYVPSMRNGRSGRDGSAEDRGNALLATLPLDDATAIELPFERQRRVAAIASVSGQSSTGTWWSFRMASVHLDPSSTIRRPLRSLGEGRETQIRAVLDHLGGHGGAVLGGDLNTWWGGVNESAVSAVLDEFPGSPHPVDEGTLSVPLGVPDPTVDYLFFDVPEGWGSRYDVVEDRYGSDHRPVAGAVWIESWGGREGGIP